MYYAIQTKLTAYLLLLSLFLQSCGTTALHNEPTLNHMAQSSKVDAEYSYQLPSGNNICFHQDTNHSWQACLSDEIGTFSREYVLPVYLEKGRIPTHLNKRQIHVIEDKNKANYVYVGSMGLKGGMVQDQDDYTEHIPNECFCPITQEIMEEPVIAQDGYTYEKSAIKQWFSMGKRISPKTGARLLHTELTPNYSMRSLIKDFKDAIPALARHQVDISNIEAAVKLREEEIEQTLALKGNLLNQEQERISQLEKRLSGMQQKSSLSATFSSRSSIQPGIRELIFKIAERESPFWDILMIEGEIQEKASRAALIDLQQVLLAELNSQLSAQHLDLGSAMKEAVLKNILGRSSRIIYARIQEAAKDAKEGMSTSAISSTNSSPVVTNIPSYQPVLTTSTSNKEEINFNIQPRQAATKPVSLSPFAFLFKGSERVSRYLQINHLIHQEIGQRSRKFKLSMDIEVLCIR